MEEYVPGEVADKKPLNKKKSPDAKVLMTGKRAKHVQKTNRITSSGNRTKP